MLRPDPFFYIEEAIKILKNGDKRGDCPNSGTDEQQKRIVEIISGFYKTT